MMFWMPCCLNLPSKDDGVWPSSHNEGTHYLTTVCFALIRLHILSQKVVFDGIEKKVFKHFYRKLLLFNYHTHKSLNITVTFIFVVILSITLAKL